MNNIFHRIITVLIAIALIISGITYNSVVTKAEEEKEYEYLLTEENKITAGTDIEYTFTVSSFSGFSILLLASNMAAGTIKLYANDEYIGTETLTDDDTSWLYSSDINDTFQYIYELSIENVKLSDWKAVFNFDTDIHYIIGIIQKKSLSDVDSKKITLAKGFTHKLSVSGAKGDIIWTSSNNSIATVNSSGKVTAKKAGVAKITATTADGQVFTYTVSVYKNEYKEKKINSSSVEYGNVDIQAYKMFYDGKGNLVLKTHIVNNCGYKMIGIKNLVCNITDNNGKEIGRLKVDNKKVNIRQGKNKNITFVIKKSSLKNKKADLHTASVNIKNFLWIYEVR